VGIRQKHVDILRWEGCLLCEVPLASACPSLKTSIFCFNTTFAETAVATMSLSWPLLCGLLFSVVVRCQSCDAGVLSCCEDTQRADYGTVAPVLSILEVDVPPDTQIGITCNESKTSYQSLTEERG